MGSEITGLRGSKSSASSQLFLMMDTSSGIIPYLLIPENEHQWRMTSVAFRSKTNTSRSRYTVWKRTAKKNNSDVLLCRHQYHMGLVSLKTISYSRKQTETLTLTAHSVCLWGWSVIGNIYFYEFILLMYRLGWQNGVGWLLSHMLVDGLALIGWRLCYLSRMEQQGCWAARLRDWRLQPKTLVSQRLSRRAGWNFLLSGSAYIRLLALSSGITPSCWTFFLLSGYQPVSSILDQTPTSSFLFITLLLSPPLPLWLFLCWNSNAETVVKSLALDVCCSSVGAAGHSRHLAEVLRSTVLFCCWNPAVPYRGIRLIGAS